MTSPRILVLDIETAPNVVHSWGLFKQNIALNQVVTPGYVLCFAAKFLGEKQVHYARVSHDPKTGQVTKKSRMAMLNMARELLDEADIVVTYNGRSFDIPRINAELIENGYEPPSPFKQVDLYLALKKVSSFTSHKLAFISQKLGIGAKVGHEGHSLWVRVMKDEPAAWKKMREYNIHDVHLTEKLYNEVRPWLPSHPNLALYANVEAPVCPTCGGARLQKRGFAYTTVGVYQRYQCGCGAWSRGKMRMATTSTRGVAS